MIIKSGVSIAGLRVEALIGVMIADRVFQDLGLTMVITSCTEGKHSRNSLHYVGQAFDVRVRGTKGTVQKVAAGCIRALGNEFDVVVESDHIHVEFQPEYNR